MKKFLSLMLAMIMVMSLVTVGAGAADFTDEETIQYNEAVAVMAELGILSGYTDGSFRPQGTLTRQVAAKIIAYIALGEDKAEDLICVEDPFSDVAATKTLAPFVNWVAKEGIVTGYDDGTFKPGNNVSGHAFLKMVLGALKIEGTYEGDGWRVNVTSAAAEAGLFEGIDTAAINLRDDATRELACQIAFNAMFYTAEAVSYKVVKADGTALATVTSKSLAENVLALNIVNGATDIVEVKNEKATLAYENYKLTRNTTGADTYGRPATVYYEDGDAIVYAVEAPVLTIVGSATEKEIFEALGKAGYQGAYNKFVVIKELWADGVKQFSATVGAKADKYPVSVANYDAIGETNAKNFASITKDDTSVWASGNGAVTEIYATSKGNEFKAVTTNEYLGKIGSDPVKADADKGTKRYVNVTVYGVGTIKLETEEFAKNDYLLVTLKNGKIDTAAKVTPVKNVTVEKYVANESVTFGGTTYKYSQMAKYGSFGLAKDYNFFANEKATYNFYLDSQGNVIAAEVYNPGDITDYAYITKIQAKSTNTNTLLETSKEDIVVAEVIFTDGTKKVVDLKITEKTVAGVKTAYADIPAAGGAVAEGTVASIGTSEVAINTWFGYEKNADGTYTFSALSGKVAVVAGDLTLVEKETKTFAIDSDNDVATDDVIFNTTSATTVTVVTTGGAVSKSTGLIKATLEGSADEILVTYNTTSKTITAIYAVKQTAAVETAASDYIYALKAGATVKGGVEWTFAEDGKVVTYTINAVKDAAGNDLTLADLARGIYTLTTVDGDVVATAVDTAKVVFDAKIELLDSTFVKTNKGTFYFADEYTVTLIEKDEVAADTLVKGDTCNFLKNTDGEIIAAYITTAKK